MAKIEKEIKDKIFDGKSGKKAFANALKYILESAIDKNSEILEGKINIGFDKDFNHIYNIKLKCGFKLY